MNNLEQELLNKIYSYNKWRHSVDLGNGTTTQGYNTIENDWKFYGMPDNVEGKSVLDIGANDGYYSFEAEKLGAKSITSIDIYSGNGNTMIDGWSIEGITMLKEFLQSKIEIVSKSVYDVQDFNRKWDLVFCSDVLSWLDNIQLAVKLICSVCDEKLVIRDTFIKDSSKTPRIEKRAHSKGFFNRMNLAFIQDELTKNGFTKIKIKQIYTFKHFEWQVNHFPAAYCKDLVNVYVVPGDGNPSNRTKVNGEWVLSEIDGFLYLQNLGWVKKEEVRVEPRFKSNFLLKTIKRILPDSLLNWYLSRNNLEKNTVEYCITATKK